MTKNVNVFINLSISSSTSLLPPLYLLYSVSYIPAFALSLSRFSSTSSSLLSLRISPPLLIESLSKDYFLLFLLSFHEMTSPKGVGIYRLSTLSLPPLFDSPSYASLLPPLFSRLSSSSIRLSLYLWLHSVGYECDTWHWESEEQEV